jgi:steroid delta-isomerase-like uncharacterized protein
MDIVERYFAAFNAGDAAAMLDCVTDDVEHHVNQGEVRHGKEAFAEFCRHMGVSYREELRDLVIFQNGDRAAAEFMVHGTYLQTDPGLPEARGQTYILPGGSFFTLRDGRIARVTIYYNLADWIRQVS